MTKTYSKTRTLVECALMIAIGTVLAQIKVFEMPNGGSVTLLSMHPPPPPAGNPCPAPWRCAARRARRSFPAGV